jgi:hypothetical protein
MSRYFTVCAIALLAAVAAPASAQETRTEAIEQAQAQKAKETHPYVPNRAERALDVAEQMLISAPRGFYPWLGSVLSGGGLAAGPGYRHTFGDTGAFNIAGGWSIRNYKTVQANLHLPELGRGRVLFDVDLQWIDAPSVPFHGLGNDTVRGDRTSFDYEPFVAGVSAAVRPARRFEIGAGVDYLQVRTGEGTRAPSIEERFTPAAAPGLGVDPSYVRARVYAQVDSRDAPGYTRRGGLLRVDFADHAQQGGTGLHGFRRVDFDGRVFFPILRANWVIALRGLVSMADAHDGHTIPFYLMPTLGGGSDLRAYSSFRFRDRNRLLLSAEYRWTPSEFVDMALFYDAGKVAAERGDLDFDGLKNSYGIGARFHTPRMTVLRIEYARGSEGGRLIFAASPSF